MSLEEKCQLTFNHAFQLLLPSITEDHTIQKRGQIHHINKDSNKLFAQSIAETVTCSR